MTYLSRLFFSLCLIPNLVCASSHEPYILILSSSGGYGHLAPTEAIKKQLEQNYEVSTYFPLEDLKPFSLEIESIYNRALKKGWNRTINFFTDVTSKHLNPKIAGKCYSRLSLNFQKVLDRQKPDLVISVCPWVNGTCAEVCHTNSIPFIQITLDSDTTFWKHEVAKVTAFQNSMISITREFEKTRGLLVKHGADSNKIVCIGHPLRREFYEKKDSAMLRKQWKINPEIPTALLMIGGMGGNKTFDYTKEILKLDTPLQLIVCCGKNEKLLQQIQQLTPPKNISLIPLGFTDHISDLMAISDFYIGKLGGNAFEECIQMELPLLVDNTTTQLTWEKTHIELVNSLGIGNDINHMKLVRWKVKQLANKGPAYNYYKNNIKTYKTNDFQKNLDTLVKTMLSQKSPSSVPLHIPSN